MLTIKELENSNARYIDPTDEQPHVHPQFFEMTAEEQQEQEFIKIREMSIIDPTDEQRGVWDLATGLNEIPFEKSLWQTAGENYLKDINNRIDKLHNSRLLTDEKRNFLVSGVMDKGVDLSKDVKIQDDGTIHILVDTSDDLSPEMLAALAYNPRHLMPLCSAFYTTTDNEQGYTFSDFHQNINLVGKPIRPGRTSPIQNLIKQMFIERVKEHIANNPTKPREKAKADYKRKFYKNTAKQAKPSPMLMSLVGKTK